MPARSAGNGLPPALLAGRNGRRLTACLPERWRARTGSRIAAALGLFWLALGIPGATAGVPAELTAEEQRGQQIYFKGESADGQRVFAFVGRSGVKVPAGVLPCASCHGEDGLGRPEGGVEPSNVTWSYLTTSYGHQHQNGRQHGAFDEDSLALAIIGQVDPAGNALDTAMPRYEMSDEDLVALIAYIKRLEFRLDPGLTDDTIRIGTLLPRTGGHGSLGQAVEATTRGYFDDINAAGGVFGRKLELVVAEYMDDDRDKTAANLRRMIGGDGGVFAVLSDFAFGAEQEVFGILEEAGVPQIDPFTLFAGHDDFPDERTFFLLSGLPDQARALAAYTFRQLDPAPESLAVVVPTAEIYGELGRAVRDEARRAGRPAPAVLRLSGDARGIAQAVSELHRSGTDALLFFGDTSVLGRIAVEGAARGWLPRLLLPGQTAGRAVFAFPKAFDRRIHLAYPNLPEDQSATGREEMQAFHKRHALPNGHLDSQVRALAAAKVLVEALRRTGRSLSRAGLVRELEEFDKFDTGQLPRLSFAANRRVGARGAHVLTVDLVTGRFRPEVVWVKVD